MDAIKMKSKIQIRYKPVQCAKCSDGKNFVCIECHEVVADELDSAKIVTRILINKIRDLENQLEDIKRAISDFDKLKFPKSHYYKGGINEP
jgi:hypothetical protein